MQDVSYQRALGATVARPLCRRKVAGSNPAESNRGNWLFPNVDPKALKGMLDRLGIKSTSIDSTQVVIHCKDKDIVIEAPEVTLIEGQGMRSFQVSGEAREVDRSRVEISEDDVRFVQEQTGIGDAALVRQTLEETKGDIAGTILKLNKKG
jgi:nascent polypeptide-associated complex subunit alpha